MLERTLKGIFEQSFSNEIACEVIVVDNDKERSAEVTVNKFRAANCLPIIYEVEPVQNIALARNKTVLCAKGNIIAFIDDDEFASPDWLDKMYNCLKTSKKDGILGPVLPHFPSGTPAWLQKSGLCERSRYATGTIVSRGLRTGNILLNRYIFEKGEIWFDPELGLSGGSDGVFLTRQIARGRRFCWCNEGLVYETISEERWKAEYYLRRYFRIGILTGIIDRRLLKLWTVPLNMILMAGYAVLLPVISLGGRHYTMRLLTRIYYNSAYLLSFLSLVKRRPRD
jgi:succinoglycan biosynthesis protein ExoM